MRDQSGWLARHYSRFNVARRLLLTGHSHQAWPDVAWQGQLEALEDAALAVDGKWQRAFRKAEQVRAGFRRFLGDPAAELALGANTHELVVRFLSGLDLRSRPRLVTSDGEFHTLRRQLSRLVEEKIEVVRVPAAPVDTLATRLAAAVDDRTAAVLVSAVMFEDARIVPGLDRVATVCAHRGAEFLIDVYHTLGVVPWQGERLGSAWLVGGGYKYLQLGEGNCFLRVPPHADRFRPVVTGWFAEFGDLSADRRPGTVGYPHGGARYAGATYDPTSHYRAARVFDFFVGHRLTPQFLRAVSLHQVGLLASRFDALDLPEQLITRDRSAAPEHYGGFLALRTPWAAPLTAALAARGVHADSRGTYLRLGPAPYLSDEQLTAAVAALAEAVVAVNRASYPRVAS